MATAALTYDVLGIGNAIVDILIRSDNKLLHDLGMNKGSMSLIGRAKANELYKYFIKNESTGHIYDIKDMSGGCAANAVAGVSSFGGSGAFIGKVDNDSLGDRFTEKLHLRGIEFHTLPASVGIGTGRAFVIVTNDAQRTMCTYLGVSAEIDEEDIDENLIKNAKIVFIEGYLFDCLAAKSAIMKAISIAHTHGNKVAFTLSNYTCVERHQLDFLNLLEHHIDILFANIDEINALFEEKSHTKSIDHVKQYCKNRNLIAALTQGKQGSKILYQENVMDMPAEKLALEEVVDSTGSGAMYVSGFLYGLSKNFSLERSGRLATLASAEVMKSLGARPVTGLSELLARV